MGSGGASCGPPCRVSTLREGFPATEQGKTLDRGSGKLLLKEEQQERRRERLSKKFGGHCHFPRMEMSCSKKIRIKTVLGTTISAFEPLRDSSRIVGNSSIIPVVAAGSTRYAARCKRTLYETRGLININLECCSLRSPAT